VGLSVLDISVRSSEYNASDSVIDVGPTDRESGWLSIFYRAFRARLVRAVVIW